MEGALENGEVQPAPAVGEPVNAPEGADVVIGGKRCKWCNSSTHLRRSHRECPFNRDNSNKE